MTVKSWDVFDTIVARRCVFPNAVFDLMGERLGIPDFTRLRKDAEHTSNDRTLKGIYANLQARTGWTPERCTYVMQQELLFESEQLYLIPEVYDQIQDGDVLVSDMYLDGDTIMKLLRAAGFKKNVKIVSTYGGKSTGIVWPMLQKSGYVIAEHTGDNYHSDVISPYRFGIASRHFRATQFTQMESMLGTRKLPQLANLMRTVRLMNPHTPCSVGFDLWNEQMTLNAPMLYLASMHLHHVIAPRHGLDTLLFATRDCVHWHRIYSAMFPRDKVVSFETSRTVFYQPTPHYLDYVRSFGDMNRVGYIDLFGTGRSAYEFFSRYAEALPFYYVIGRPDDVAFKAEYESAGRAFAGVSPLHMSSLEHLNYDVVGTLLDYNENGGVRGEPLMGQKSIRIAHMAMDRFVDEMWRSRIDAPLPEKELLDLLLELNMIADRGTLLHQLVPHDPQWYIMQRETPKPLLRTA